MEYYLAILFGILTAIGWGLAPIFSKRSYEDGGNPIVASLMLSIIGFIILLLLTFVIYSPSIIFEYTLFQVYPFIITGIVGTGFGRFLSYKGVDVLGASVNSSFIATHSVFAVILAYIFIGEKLTVINFAGIASVVIGLYVVSSSDGGNKSQKIKFVHLLIPFLAAFFYGVGSVIRRFGFEFVFDIPIIYATLINEFTALILLSTYTVLKKDQVLDSIDIYNYKKFTLSGIFNIFGTSSSFAALSFGPVYIGSTIGSTSTIITAIATYIFLGDIETVNKKLYTGGIAVVIGVILVVI